MAKSDSKKIMIIVLWIAVALLNIKSIFADFGPDQTYAIAISYRHIMGDRMFLTMWEPHQTSIFLVDIAMWVYHIFIPSFEGVAIFLQIYGVLIYALVTYALYKVMIQYIDRYLTNIICIFFMAFRAKLMVFPEFSNMHICFSVLLFLCLVQFFNKENRLRYLILAGISMCMLVLSYPSCLISFIGVLIILGLYSDKKRRAIGIFSLTCAIIGIIYAGYFVTTLGVDQFVDNLKLIFTSDSSHTGNTVLLSSFLRGTVLSALWIGVSCCLGLIINIFVHSKFLSILVSLSVTDIALLIVAGLCKKDWTTIFLGINLVIIMIGARYAKLLDDKCKQMWVIALILSVSSALAVLMLTNQELISILAYMPLAVMISLIPVWNGIQRSDEKHLIQIAIVFCAWIIVHRGLAVYGYINTDGRYLILQEENYVRVGPTKWIITSLSECNEARYGIDDWKEYVPLGASVLMIEKSWTDPIVYLYNESDVSQYSTIDTATYDESLEKYWEKYEFKKPEIVAVKAWDMVEDRDYYGWTDEYLKENCELYASGTYWHFYRVIK